MLFMALIREKREKMGHSGYRRPDSIPECLCICRAGVLWLQTLYDEHVFLTVVSGHTRNHGIKCLAVMFVFRG